MLPKILIFVILTPYVFGIPSIFKAGLGRIDGATESYAIGNGSSVEVDVFKGIPYAMELDKSQRFKNAKPNPEVADDVVLNAIKFGFSCPQQCGPFYEPIRETYFGNTFGVYDTNENCLTLNIYRPKEVSEPKKPVIIWIHGGAFLSGAGSDYDGGTLSAYADVIVVTINYRLGAFGFLSIDDIEPNIGLNDQHVAIKWVYDNIDAFGGDESKITLAGAGAGAESVTYHMLQPYAHTYFQRVIALSGVISEDKIIKNPSEVAEIFIEDVCSENEGADSEEEEDIDPKCLEMLETEMIVQGPVIDKGGSILSYFGPTATTDSQSIDELLKRSMQAEQFDLMVGVTEYDSSAYIEYLKSIGEIEDDGVSKSVFSGIEATISNFYNIGYSLVSAIISNVYTDWSDPNNDAARLEELKELLNDWFYVKPATELNRARTAAGSRKTYYMVFDHKTNSSDISSEASNSEMVPYIFGNPFQSGIKYLFNDEERVLSHKTMDFVKNFVYYGNPGYGVDEDWEPYTAGGEEYLHITIDESTVKQRYQAEKMAAWLVTVPRVIEVQEESMEESDKVDVLGKSLSGDEASEVIEGLVFGIIAIISLGVLIATILFALRNKQAIVYDMENNDDKHDIPSPPIYTPPSTLQKPNPQLMATAETTETPTIDNHVADPLPDYNEHIYDNQPVVAVMHTTPAPEEEEPQRPVSFTTFSGADDSALLIEDEQERPDSALAALDNAAYEDSP